MMRVIAAALTVVVGLGGAVGPVVAADAPKTYFDYIERSWACAEVELRTPLEFRDGVVLAYPGVLVDVVYARHGRPQSVMIVEELVSNDSKPFLAKDMRFFGPIQVLPDHSYWRDNLPNTPRHGVLGGHRYVFRGDDLEPAKDLTKRYGDTLGMKMPERRQRQQAILVDALGSSVKVLREDALRRLTNVPVPASQYDEATIRRLGDFAKGDAPESDRAQIVAMMGPAGMKALVPDLELLAKRDDVVGASALVSLEQLDVARSTAELEALLDAKTEDVRAYAARGLGERAGEDAGVMARVAALLASDEPPKVRAAAATGLGRGGDPKSLDALSAALDRGDEVSRVAAHAIAKIDSDRSIELLKKAIVDGPNEAHVGGVLALVEVRRECKDCAEFLKEQHESHPDAAVRDLIAIVLELNVRHDH